MLFEQGEDSSVKEAMCPCRKVVQS